MIQIDQDLCIGCGTCEALCPQTFKVDDSGKAQVISQDESDCSRNGAESCPVQAISIK